MSKEAPTTDEQTLRDRISNAGWEYARTYPDKYRRRIPYDGLDIASAHMDGLEANARLIDLLEAAKRLRAVINDHVSLADVDALEAAIAKAEGRS